MFKNKRITYSLTLIPLIIILILFIWFFSRIFEGEPPVIALGPKPEYLSSAQKFTINISDMKRGLKKLTVSYNQGGREVTVFEKQFPFQGLLNKAGAHNFETEIEVDPAKLHLAQGRVDLNVQVWDYSRRSGGDGNMTLTSHKMTVDTIPPSARAISRMHNVNQGGSCLVVYRISSDTIESGVYVNEKFFPGFPAKKDSDKGYFLAYFSIPYNSNLSPDVYLWAKDRAENTSQSTFYYHIRRKRFRREKMNISDRFLNRVIPYFSYYNLNQEDSNLQKFLKINNDIRKENNERIIELGKDSMPNKVWDGVWLRLEKAATMAKFADHRSYIYKGKKVDEKYHLGTDLASLANSPVKAANNGKILFAERNGIYGLMIAIDHGQGLMSIYGHLSSMEVQPDQEVKKGDLIGHTGSTGLAGGDHLHFGMLVNGNYVNPIEWWDNHWLKDNIYRKLDLIKEH